MCLKFVKRAVVLLLVSFSGGLSSAAPTTAPAVDFSHTWLLHLPGIGGEMPVDRDLVDGLRKGGWKGPLTVYDWTENDPGLDALRNHKRNMREAAKIADMIQDHVRKDPKVRIVVTSHSGGTGLAVWALENLPDDVQVQDVLLLASALSPGYDLSHALKHVRGHAYVFYSQGDALVLGTGTKMFGTIDGVRSEAAGLIGFSTPKGADPNEYRKLVQKPYDEGWQVYGHFGNHIGCMSGSFADHVLAPILIEDANAAQADGHASTRPCASQIPTVRGSGK